MDDPLEVVRRAGLDLAARTNDAASEGAVRAKPSDQLLPRSLRQRDEPVELVQFFCVAALLDFVVVESDGCHRSLPAEFGHVMQNLPCARTALRLTTASRRLA
jgi:hypothetical protein